MKEHHIRKSDGVHVIRSDDDRIADALAMSKRGVGFSPEDDKKAFEGIEGLSDSFQKEYCPQCIHFNKRTEDFWKKVNRGGVSDCEYHCIDIVGQCWNYQNKERPFVGVHLEDDSTGNYCFFDLNSGETFSFDDTGDLAKFVTGRFDKNFNRGVTLNIDAIRRSNLSGEEQAKYRALSEIEERAYLEAAFAVFIPRR